VAAAEKLELTARGYYRALRVARTITDMNQVAQMGETAVEGAEMGAEMGADMRAVPAPEVPTAVPAITRCAIEEALSYRAPALNW